MSIVCFCGWEWVGSTSMARAMAKPAAPLATVREVFTEFSEVAFIPLTLTINSQRLQRFCCNGRNERLSWGKVPINGAVMFRLAFAAALRCAEPGQVGLAILSPRSQTEADFSVGLAALRPGKSRLRRLAPTGSGINAVRTSGE